MLKKITANLIFIAFIVFTTLSLKAQNLPLNLPAFSRNSVEDTNVYKDAALQFSLLKDGSLFYKETSLKTENIKVTLENHFEKYFPINYAYVHGDTETKLGKLLELSKNLYQFAEIKDIRLVVIPYKLVIIPSENVQETMEKSGQGYTLNLKLSSQEINRKEANQQSKIVGNDEPAPPAKNGQVSSLKPKSKTVFKSKPLIIARKSFNQITLNDVAITEKDLLIAIQIEFKNREENGVFRFGTNEIDKSVYIKVSPDLEFKYLVGLADQLNGLGANSIYLKIDQFVN